MKQVLSAQNESLNVGASLREGKFSLGTAAVIKGSALKDSFDLFTANQQAAHGRLWPTW